MGENDHIPLCEHCFHKATMHVVDDEERRECMEWSCSCEQFEMPDVAYVVEVLHG